MSMTSPSPPRFALLHQGVEHHGRHRPDAPAIDDGSRVVTYGQLLSAMEQVAGVLHAAGIPRHARIGIFLDSGIAAYTGMLGALRSGGCYVPVPPAFPPERASLMILDADLAAVVTTRDRLDRLAGIVPHLDGRVIPALLVLDADSDALRRDACFAAIAPAFATVWGTDALAAVPPPPCVPTIEEDLAYILFTSGTTGKPKGVMLSHRNVMSFLRWAVDHFQLSPSDRMSNHANITFDISVLDIFGGFLAGATVCPVIAPGDRAYPAGFIKQRRLTYWFSVPNVLTTMRALNQLTPEHPLPDLRVALFAGEPLTPENVAAWQAAHPRIPIFNLYGPTEAAISVTCHNVGVDSPFGPGSPVPIGRPCRDTEILVLKRDSDQPADASEIGRLFICGSQVSPGYWRRPDLTEKVFVSNPFKRDFSARMYDSGDLAYKDEDGIVYYVGRADSQIKYQGYRIELADVEAALRRHGAVLEAAVVLAECDGPMLIGAVHADNPEPSLEDAILDFCSSILPVYMVPSRLFFLPSLPRNLNGKINRQAILAAVQPLLDGEPQ